MSLLNLTSAKDLPLKNPANLPERLGFFEGVAENFRMSVINYNVDSFDRASGELTQERDDLYERLTGRSTTLIWQGDRESEIFNEKRQAKIDQQIKFLKEIDREKYVDLMTYDEIKQESERRALQSQIEYSQRFRYTPGMSKYLSALAGGVGAAAVDPFQASMMVGTMGMSRLYGVGQSVLRTAAIEAAINSGAEALLQPKIAEWQNKIGAEYGISDALTNVLFAGAAGAGFSVVPSAVRVVKNMNLSEAAAAIMEVPGITPKFKAGLDALRKAAEIQEGSPTPNLRDHQVNINESEKAFKEGRMPNIDDIKNTRLTDDIDGIPSDALEFLDAKSEFKIKSTFEADGAAPIIIESVRKLYQMSRDQIRIAVKESLIPLLRNELKEDYAREARRLGKAIDTKIMTRLYQIDVEITALKKSLKEAKANIAKRREHQLAKATTFEQKKHIKSKATRDRAEVDKAHIEKIIPLKQEVVKNKRALSSLEIQKDRRAALKEMTKGNLPSGDGYTATMIRRTIDKITDAAYDNAKRVRSVAEEKRVLIEKDLKNRGIIKSEVKLPDEVAQSIKDAESMLDFEMEQMKSNMDKAPDDMIVISDDGSVTTKKKFMEQFNAKESEIKAIDFCAIGGSK